MDLIIRNARLSTRPDDALVDIGIENGRITAIAPRLVADGQEHDAAGGLVCASLIETIQSDAAGDRDVGLALPAPKSSDDRRLH
jgi:predicted amidohydrolase